jgi:hypothetical protein
MKFQVGDLVRQNLEHFVEKDMIDLIPSASVMQGMVVSVRRVPDNFINVSAEWIVEVLWANSYINKTAYYYDEELIIVSRGCE